MTACGDTNPWDATIRCQRPAGHENKHRVDERDWVHQWTDRCHFPDDDCPIRHDEATR